MCFFFFGEGVWDSNPAKLAQFKSEQETSREARRCSSRKRERERGGVRRDAQPSARDAIKAPSACLPADMCCFVGSVTCRGLGQNWREMHSKKLMMMMQSSLWALSVCLSLLYIYICRRGER